MHAGLCKSKWSKHTDSPGIAGPHFWQQQLRHWHRLGHVAVSPEWQWQLGMHPISFLFSIHLRLFTHFFSRQELSSPHAYIDSPTAYEWHLRAVVKRLQQESMQHTDSFVLPVLLSCPAGVHGIAQAAMEDGADCSRRCTYACYACMQLYTVLHNVHVQPMSNGRGLDASDPSWQMMQAARSSGGMEALLAGPCLLCCACILILSISSATPVMMAALLPAMRRHISCMRLQPAFSFPACHTACYLWLCCLTAGLHLAHACQ